MSSGQELKPQVFHQVTGSASFAACQTMSQLKFPTEQTLLGPVHLLPLLQRLQGLLGANAMIFLAHGHKIIHSLLILLLLVLGS